MIYENNIYLNGVKVLSQRNKGRNIFVYLENGTVIQKSELRGKEIEIECSECGNKIKIKFYNGLLEKKYICQKCLHTGERNAMYGKTHTQELKDRLSKERKGKWYIGEKNPMYGKNIKDYMTASAYEEWKRNISKSVSGEKNPMYGKNIKDYMTIEAYKEWKQKHIDRAKNLTEEERIKIGRRFKSADEKWRKNDPDGYIKSKKKAAHISRLKGCNYKKSKIEEKVEKWLIDNNINYEYSCIIGFGNTCFQYDFIIHNKRILIEVQGDYWHGNPNLYNDDGTDGKKALNETQRSKKEIDVEKKEFAENKKFKLLYIWETDINNDNFESLKEILEND